MIRDEIADGRRVLCACGEAVAFMPVCARYSYEVWVAPRRHELGAGVFTAGTLPEGKAAELRAVEVSVES